MNKLDLIKDLLQELEPSKCEIQDDSHKHSMHYTASENDIYPSHVTIKITSEKFRDKNLVQRQKLVNSCLLKAFENGLHAASMKTLTPEEDQT